MRIHCYNCHVPFEFNREDTFNALDEIVSGNLKHFNLQCPRCRKSNKLSKKQLIAGAPGWKPAHVREQEKQ